jgi:hypothetical protein
VHAKDSHALNTEKKSLLRSLVTTTLTSRLSAMDRVGIKERTNGDNHVDEHAQHALQIIGFPVAEERADHENSQDEGNSVEDLEVEIHVDTKTPADEHDERSVKEGSLDAGTENVGKGKVHLVVPGFVDGGEMF